MLMSSSFSRRAVTRERSISVVTLLCALLMPIPGFSQPSPVALPSDVQYVTTVEGINEYRLPNGLRVLLLADPTKSNITVNITYMVGSRQEDYGETGMAHLLEHLMFRGSTHHPNVPKELKDHGTRPNGITSSTAPNISRRFRLPRKTCSGRSIWRRTAWSMPSSLSRISIPR